MVCEESFFRTFDLLGHSCTIIQCGDKKELRIDNQTFEHLYNLERNKQFFTNNPEPTSSIYQSKPLFNEKKSNAGINNNFYQQENSNKPKLFSFNIKPVGEAHHSEGKNFTFKINENQRTHVSTLPVNAVSSQQQTKPANNVNLIDFDAPANDNNNNNNNNNTDTNNNNAFGNTNEIPQQLFQQVLQQQQQQQQQQQPMQDFLQQQPPQQPQQPLQDFLQQPPQQPQQPQQQPQQQKPANTLNDLMDIFGNSAPSFQPSIPQQSFGGQLLSSSNINFAQQQQQPQPQQQQNFQQNFQQNQMNNDFNSMFG